MIESPETPHVHGEHKGGRHWFDVVMAIAVLLVSAGSLYVALHTGSTMEKLVEQNQRLVQANSLPLLAFGHGNYDPERERQRIRFELSNVGAGPARVVWVEVRHAGKAYPDMQALVDAVHGRNVPDLRFMTTPVAPALMPAGQTYEMLGWLRPTAGSPAADAWSSLNEARFGLEVEACYCSLFDQCWISTLDGGLPQSVARCDTKGRTSIRG